MKLIECHISIACLVTYCPFSETLVRNKGALRLIVTKQDLPKLQPMADYFAR